MQQAIEDYSVTLGTHHRVICNYPMEADYSFTLGTHHLVICNYPMEADYSFTLGTHHHVECNYPMEAEHYLITTSYGYFTEVNRLYYIHMGSFCVSTAAEYDRRILHLI